MNMNLYFREDSLEFCEVISDYFVNAIYERLKNNKKGIGIDTAILSYAAGTIMKIDDEKNRYAVSKHPIHIGNGREYLFIRVEKFTENAIEIINSNNIYQMSVEVLEDKVVVYDKTGENKSSSQPLIDGIDVQNAALCAFISTLWRRRNLK